MKQVCFFIIALLASAVSLHAQTEAKGDSIRSHSLPEGTPPEGTFLPETKNYDGFLLDMSLMRMEAPRLPRFTLEIPDASKDYSRIFRLNPDATYSQGLSNVFSLTNATVYSMNPFGLTGFWSSPENGQLQTEERNAYQYIRRVRQGRLESSQPFGIAVGEEQLQGSIRNEIRQRCIRHTHRSTAGQPNAVLTVSLTDWYNQIQRFDHTKA